MPVGGPGKLGLSYTTDYVIAGDDRGQSVTYVQGKAASPQTFAVNYATWEELTVSEVMASGGVYSEGDRRWCLGVAEFPAGVVPVQGDRFTDASGQLWTIPLEVSTLDILGRYIVHTRRGR